MYDGTTTFGIFCAVHLIRQTPVERVQHSTEYGYRYTMKSDTKQHILISQGTI